MEKNMSNNAYWYDSFVSYKIENVVKMYVQSIDPTLGLDGDDPHQQQQQQQPLHFVEQTKIMLSMLFCFKYFLMLLAAPSWMWRSTLICKAKQGHEN